MTALFELVSTTPAWSKVQPETVQSCWKVTASMEKLAEPESLNVAPLPHSTIMFELIVGECTSVVLPAGTRILTAFPLSFAAMLPQAVVSSVVPSQAPQSWQN